MKIIFFGCISNFSFGVCQFLGSVKNYGIDSIFNFFLIVNNEHITDMCQILQLEFLNVSLKLSESSTNNEVNLKYK